MNMRKISEFQITEQLAQCGRHPTRTQTAQMNRKKGQRLIEASSRTSSKRRSSSHKQSSVSADDVIVVLLDLFDRLGVNATHVASRVKSPKIAAQSSGKLYSHNATIGELLAAWHQNPEYVDQAGNPVAIRMSGQRSFTALARKVVPNVTPRSLLTQLRSVDAVRIETNGHISINARSVAVYTDRALAIHYTLTSLLNYIKTLTHNLDSDPTNANQLFHRVAWSETFDRALIPALKIKLRRQGQNFLESFDNWMFRKIQKETRRKTKTAQVSIGVYLSVSDE
jgi:hypothetical protein